MPIISELGGTFDTVAAVYEKMRPGYPAGLYDTVFRYINIDENSTVGEVGIGAGQATLPVLMKGCRLTAFERGEIFTALCREKFASYPGFSAVTGKFEETQTGENAYDLVFSASAFHWIPEKEGYEKVFAMLKRGGAFARFANHPFRDTSRGEMSAEIDGAYKEYYCAFYPDQDPTPPDPYTEAEAAQRAAIAEKYGFTDIEHHLFYRTRSFTSAEYVQLLGTYSDHIALPDGIRIPFFAKIGEIIDSYGGKLNIYDTIDLQLARKPL